VDILLVYSSGLDVDDENNATKHGGGTEFRATVLAKARSRRAHSVR
jgi:hypothetical protein